MTYTKEDLETDVNYLIGWGMDEAPALEFITHIIKVSGGRVE